MGIPGLLPALKSITTTVHVNVYRGQKVAIDAYCWLHKGAYACSQELCEGEATEKCVNYCMQRVELLLSNGVTPIVVFDGGRLPMKAEEETSRRRVRELHLEKARAHRAAGNMAAAFESYQKAVDISPTMAKQFIEALKGAGVEFIVAPYEADAQMAYMALRGDVQTVITEDSDLLAYGCPRVFYKMDRSGDGQQICRADLANNKELAFTGFTDDMFLEMCILVGCDFLKALPGIGIKKAHGHMRKLRSYTRVVKSLRFSGTSVPRDYEDGFQRAVWTFRHQRVFCPDRQTLVHLRDLPPGGLWLGGQRLSDSLEFLGPPIPADLAAGVAKGDIDPMTQQPFEALPSNVLQPRNINAEPSTGISRGALKSKTKRPRSGHQPLLPVQSNMIHSYFTKLQGAESTSCAPSPKGARPQKEDMAPHDGRSQKGIQRVSGLAKAHRKSSLPVTRRSLSSSAIMSEAGSDDESPAERASRHVDSTGSQPESSRPVRVSGGSIFSRFRMCPVAQPSGDGASAQSTPADSQAASGGPGLPARAMSSGDDREAPRASNARANGQAPAAGWGADQGGLAEEGQGRQADADLLDMRETCQKKSSPSDLVNFSQSPPLEAQRTLQRPLLQGPDLDLLFDGGLHTVPDTPEDGHAGTGHMTYLVDDQQQERAQVDRLFGQQSCSMELASCRLITTGLDADKLREDTAMNALFSSVEGDEGGDDECALNALFGRSRGMGCSNVRLTMSPLDPRSDEVADPFLPSKAISPLPCPSPEFEALSRPARRGMLLPNLTTRCSVSPLNRSPDLEAQRTLTGAAFEGKKGLSHTGGFAPLSHGLLALQCPGTLPSPARVPSTIELLAQEEEISTWGVGSGRLDVGPLEGGRSQLRVGDSMALQPVWTDAPILSPPESDASPGPLREGLDPLHSGSRRGGPLQQAIEASSLRRVRISVRGHHSDDKGSSTPVADITSHQECAGLQSFMDSGAIHGEPDGELLLLRSPDSNPEDMGFSHRVEGSLRSDPFLPLGGSPKGKARTLQVAIPARAASASLASLERTGSGKRKTPSLSLDTNPSKRAAVARGFPANRPSPSRLGPSGSPSRGSHELAAARESWPFSEGDMAMPLLGSPVAANRDFTLSPGKRALQTSAVLSAWPEEQAGHVGVTDGLAARNSDYVHKEGTAASSRGDYDAVNTKGKSRKTTSSFFQVGPEARASEQGSIEEGDGEEAGGGFHSLRHMPRFEREAKAALDRVQAFAERRGPQDEHEAGGHEHGLAHSMEPDDSTKRLRQPFCPPRPHSGSSAKEGVGTKWRNAGKSLQKRSTEARNAIAKPFKNFAFGPGFKKKKKQ